MNTEGTDLLRVSPRTFRRTMVRTVAEPSLYLDFTASNQLDPRITFTRASSATFFDSAGVLQTAASGAARFTYDPATLQPQGLLIEEQRTNLCLQSEDFSTTWAATQSSITTNAAVSPSGTSTADKLIEDIANAQHFVFQVVTGLVSGGTYTYSFFAKSAERTNVQILFAQGGNNALASANLTAGTISAVTINGGAWTGGSATITNVGNGWYRLTLTATIVGSTALSCRIVLEDTPGNATYTGNGTSGLFIWGAQLELGAFATSVIPTTTTALTRNADAATMTGTNFSSWYNASEGTVVVDFQASPTAGVDRRIFAFQDQISVGSNGILGFLSNAAQKATSLNVFVNTANIGRMDSVAAFAANTFAKSAYAFRNSDRALSVNGAAAVTSASSFTMPSVDRMSIGIAPDSTACINGTIRSIRYYAARLPDAQLQALTG
jgi:hypothetical protein